MSIDVKSLVQKSDQPDAGAEIQAKLADILEPAVNASSLDGGADSVAASVDELYASGYDSEEKAELFLWTFWAFLIEVAKRVPANDDARQNLLVSVVDKLKSRDRGSVKLWGNETKVWGDLALLGPAMREAWNFHPKFDGTDADNAGVQHLISLNSFAARLFGASLTDWENFGLWAFRDGLENEPENDLVRSTYIAVSHQWVAHAGRILREKGSKPQDLDEAGKRAFKPGRLFQGGASGFTDKRWEFWQQRLETMGKDVASEDAKAQADKTVEAIKALLG